MIKGHDAIKNRVVEIINKGFEATNKEQGILECLKIALEMTARGLKFENVSLENSAATTFKIDVEKNTLIPPFSSIDGLGDTVANTIVSEREKSDIGEEEQIKNDKVKENNEYKEEVEQARKDLEHYRNVEKTLQNTLDTFLDTFH